MAYQLLTQRMPDLVPDVVTFKVLSTDVDKGLAPEARSERRRLSFELLLRLVGGAHGDEAKPTRAAGHAIHHQVRFGDRAKRRKGVLQVVFSGVEGKISHKQFVTHVMFTVLDESLLQTDCFRKSDFKSSLN